MVTSARLKAETEIARNRVLEQWKWINQHGRTLAAYVATYGSQDDPDHGGNGGEAIWEADWSTFQKLQDRLTALLDRSV